MLIRTNRELERRNLSYSLRNKIPNLMDGEDCDPNPNHFEGRRHGLAKGKVIIVPYSDLWEGSWRDESGRYRTESQALYKNNKTHIARDAFYAVRWVKITKEEREQEVKALEKKLAMLKERDWKRT